MCRRYLLTDTKHLFLQNGNMVNSMLTLQTPTRTQKLRIPDDIANWHLLKVTKQQFFLGKKKKKKEKKRKEKEKFPISSLSSSLAG